MIVNPADNTITADGINGPPRGAIGDLCGGSVCHRNEQRIKSGTMLEVGCSHSECNAIFNAARQGRAVVGHHMLVSGEPCLMCAKAIVQCGIERVYCIRGGYLGAGPGVDFLLENGVTVSYRHGPQDPRKADQ